ncbi:MAG: ribosome maturation factor RimM [Candidatus Nanopelagicales bacterium]
MRVVVGRIGRAQGIRGEVTVEVRTDAPEERFSSGAVLCLDPAPGRPAQVTVEGHRWQGSRLILALAGVEDRTAAEVLRDALLHAEVDLSDTADDEYHDLALIGLAVRDATGAHLGRIGEVLHLPSQDVLSVSREGAAELLVPFVKALVPEVDLAGGFVVVDLPEGLAELTES